MWHAYTNMNETSAPFMIQVEQKECLDSNANMSEYILQNSGDPTELVEGWGWVTWSSRIWK